jgi:hypothetical protein
MKGMVHPKEKSQSVRKRVISPPAVALAPPCADDWIDLKQIAEVEVTSEDPDCPVECAFNSGSGRGWRAGGRGEQAIRLRFDQPQRLQRIRLRFVETETERTQEFSLRWWGDDGGAGRELVRQQWNFSPRGSTTEIEDYRVDLDAVLVLELTIHPDPGGGEAIATLAEWRLA